MHRIFQNFIDRLSSASNSDALRDAMSQAAAGLDLSCFAYLSMPDKTGGRAGFISNYPSAWTTHYFQRHYERFDPVIIRALGHPEPFEWGLGFGSLAPFKSQELFEEAARFGIRYGFTIPIHSDNGPVAAVTFAADERRPQFERTISEHARVLQLMAMYFHTPSGGLAAIGPSPARRYHPARPNVSIGLLKANPPGRLELFSAFRGTRSPLISKTLKPNLAYGRSCRRSPASQHPN